MLGLKFIQASMEVGEVLEVLDITQNTQQYHNMELMNSPGKEAFMHSTFHVQTRPLVMT